LDVTDHNRKNIKLYLFRFSDCDYNISNTETNPRFGQFYTRIFSVYKISISMCRFNGTETSNVINQCIVYQFSECAE